MKIRTLTQAFLLLFSLTTFQTIAQIGINATGAAPAINAMLDISSTTKGALLPRMTTAQRTALTTSDGLTVYDTDTKSYWFVKGTVWTEMVGGAGSGSSPWTISGTNIYNTNTGNVGIGSTTPTTAKLVISGSTGTEGIDLSSTDQYANMRVIRNSLFGIDKDMFIGYESGTNSSLRLFSNNIETLTVKNTNVGIGVLNPVYPLETKGRIRINDLGAGESAGIWFNNNGNTSLNTFLGIDPTNQLGIYSPALTKNIFTANMTTGGVRIEGPSVSSPSVNTLSIGGYGKIEVDKPGIVGGRFIIKENGLVGIDNNNPNSPLSFNNAFGDKISLLDNGAGNRYNISINPTDRLYFSTPGTSIDVGRDISFGHATATGNYWERFNIKANGALAVNGTEGTNGQVLTSNGSGAAASWNNLPKIQSIIMPSVSYTVPNNNLNVIPGASVTFTAPSAGKLVIWPNVTTGYGCTNPIDHCYLVWLVRTLLDGSAIRNTNLQATYAYLQIPNDQSIAPIVVDVSAGLHTISFTETLTSIAPFNPYIIVSLYAQFIPN